MLNKNMILIAYLRSILVGHIMQWKYDEESKNIYGPGRCFFVLICNNQYTYEIELLLKAIQLRAKKTNYKTKQDVIDMLKSVMVDDFKQQKAAWTKTDWAKQLHDHILVHLSDKEWAVFADSIAEYLLD